VHDLIVLWFVVGDASILSDTCYNVLELFLFAVFVGDVEDNILEDVALV
jgi:hypothetical protein